MLYELCIFGMCGMCMGGESNWEFLCPPYNAYPMAIGRRTLVFGRRLQAGRSRLAPSKQRVCNNCVAPMLHTLLHMQNFRYKRVVECDEAEMPLMV